MNEKQPLVSIGVAVYNAQKTLVKCVESLTNQTYRNIEIILVNDGSTDDSPQMCDTFAKRDSRIKVIHQENQGRAGAVQACIDNATGFYMGFLDSDDWVEPVMYEKLVDAAVAGGGLDVVQCGHWIIFGDEITEYHASKIDFLRWNKIVKRELYVQNAKYSLQALDIKYAEDLMRMYPIELDVKTYELLHECYVHYDTNNTEHSLQTQINCINDMARGGTLRRVVTQITRDKNLPPKSTKAILRVCDEKLMFRTTRACGLVAKSNEPKREKILKMKLLRKKMKGAHISTFRHFVFKTLMFFRMYRTILAIIKT